MGAPRYDRSTTAVDGLDSLPDGLRSAVHACAPQLEGTLSDGAPAWWTHSVNLPGTGLLGRVFGRRSNSADPDVEHDVLVVVDDTHLHVVTWGAERGAAALEVSRKEATAGTAPTITPLRPATGDHDRGVSIVGFAGVEGARASFWFGLGPEPAADDCVRALRDATA